MLVLPGPPKILPNTPSVKFGEYAKPTRGPKSLYLVGVSVLGTPGSPGYTKPLGDKGKSTDCSPGMIDWILPCVSYHGVLYSQRRPRFNVRFGFTFQESWP